MLAVRGVLLSLERAESNSAQHADRQNPLGLCLYDVVDKVSPRVFESNQLVDHSTKRDQTHRSIEQLAE